MQSSTKLALTIRVLIALATITFFQPDEYFQALEPAHHLVFGYGHLTWEWLSPHPIRSFIYPALNVPIFWLLRVTRLADSAYFGDWFLILGPKILHGLLAAGTDIWLCKLTRTVLGVDAVPLALLLSLSSFFHALALSRSFSNSLETSLSTIAFSFYPWDASSHPNYRLVIRSLEKTVLFSALACLIRPTNALIWVYLYGSLLWILRKRTKIILSIIRRVTMVATIALLLQFSIDSVYYGRAIFTPLNFLLTNLSSVSLFYGSNPWHYYVTQALPILCTTALPFSIHGMWCTLTGRSQKSRALQVMLKTILWSITVYSLAGHKEWRFLHPLLPLLHVMAARSLLELNSSSNRAGYLPIKQKHLVLLLLTLPASLYVVLFYCSAPISVLAYFRSLPHEELNQTTIGFLMPCHSTPGYAYLHRKELADGRMWALGCEPPSRHQDLASYHDQTDIFYASPQTYLSTYFPDKVNQSFPLSPFPTSIPGSPSVGVRGYPWKHEWPEYLVFFGDLLHGGAIRQLLEGKGYVEVWKAGPEWHGEGRRKGGVRVWKWRHHTWTT